MKQVQEMYAKAILKSPYKRIITATKNKYYVMEDKRSLEILDRVMSGEKLPAQRRKSDVRH